MNACVVTVGGRLESLGALKLARWLSRQGYAVDQRTEIGPLFDRYDLYCFSCVFSWKLPRLVEMAQIAKEIYQGEVWIGGPAVTFHPANARYVEQATGVRPHLGLDDRFDQEPGAYPMVYFSRGCPAYTPACGNCPVPRLEGTAFRYYPEAQPAGLLLDNNLSALAVDYQDFIIRRYQESWPAHRKVDANSGFEPHSFTAATLQRWQSFPLVCWRFGYDDLTERDQALEMMRLLRYHGYEGERVRVYCLLGNEPKDACRQRLGEIIAHGMHPWPQRLRPLDWLGPDGTLPCRFDWTEADLVAWQRFYSIAGLWKRLQPEEFFYQGRYALTTTEDNP